MASPFQIATLGNVAGLAYSPQCRVGILCDGSILVADDTSATVVTLHQITSPSGASPTITALSQTFTYGSATTALVCDLLVINNGTTTSDVWLLLCSNAGAGATLVVAHATYTASGASWSWGNTGTTAATATQVNSQTGTLAWNGTDLILVYRDLNVSYKIMATYTATKAGSSGWQTAFQLGTSSGGSSQTHEHPILVHDATLAGGSGATALVYSIDSGSGSNHSDQLSVLILLDSASTAAAANWKAEVKDASTTGQGFGSAFLSACVDPATGTVHVLFSSSAAGTGGVIGVSYKPVTVTSAGVASWGTRVTVDTTTGGGTIGICVDATSVLYAFYATGTVGTSGTISYRTMASGGSSWSSATATVGNTAGDGFPHVPSRDQAVSGYVPLMYQHGTSSFTAQYDNTITAGSAASALTATCAGVGATTATLSEAGAFTGTAAGVGATTATVAGESDVTSVAAGAGATTATFAEAAVLTSTATGAGATTATLAAAAALTSTAAGVGAASAPLSYSGPITAVCAGVGATAATVVAAAALSGTAAGAGGGSGVPTLTAAPTTATCAGAGTTSAALSETAAATSAASGAGATVAAATVGATLTAVGAGAGGTATTLIMTAGGLLFTTQTQTGISGGPPGNNTIETDVTFEDASGNGIRFGFIPAYGGRGGVPWYDIAGGAVSIPQGSLATSKAGSNFHIYSHVGAAFWASEDPPYPSVIELSSLAVHNVRAYIDSGTSAVDANGFTWRARTALFPGEPFAVIERIDMVNAASVTTATTDSYEVTALSSLTQVTQGGVVAWQLANGGYGSVGGSATTPLPSSLTATEPQYLWIAPQAGSGVTHGVLSVRKQTGAAFVGATAANLASQVNSTRLKVYHQYDRGTATPAATRTWYQLLCYATSMTAAKALSISADYLNPDTGWDDDEACYIVSAATNVATFTPSFPTNVTKRWLNHYKITGYTANQPPLLALPGATLVANTDYWSAVDTSAQVAYVVLGRGIVASGAGAGEVNTGTLTFYSPVVTASSIMAGIGGATAVPSVGNVFQLTTTAAAAGGATAALRAALTPSAIAAGVGFTNALLPIVTAAVSAQAAGTGGTSATITLSGGTTFFVTAQAAGIGATSAVLAAAATLTAIAAGAGGVNANLTATAALTAIAAGSGSTNALIGIGVPLSSTAAGAGGTSSILAAQFALTAVAGGTGATSAVLGALALASIAPGAGGTTAAIQLQWIVSALGAGTGAGTAVPSIGLAAIVVAAGAGGGVGSLLAALAITATAAGTGGMLALTGGIVGPGALLTTVVIAATLKSLVGIQPTLTTSVEIDG